MKFFALKAGKVDRNVAIVMIIQLAFQTAIFAAYGEAPPSKQCHI